MFDRCKLSVLYEIYTDFTLLLPEVYQRSVRGPGFKPPTVFLFLVYIVHKFLHVKAQVETRVNITWETLEMGSTESCVLLESKTWD